MPRAPRRLKTVKEIQANKSVGALSPLQFVSLATNCFVWVTYGLLKMDMTILLPNASGAYVCVCV